MTVRATTPDGVRWLVRRSVVRGPGGRGWRWRWRAPDWLGQLASLLEFGQLAEIPVVGVVVVVLLTPVVVVLLLVGLPFVAIGLLEALALALVATVGLAAATLAGRPVLVRAERVEPDDDPTSTTTHLLWAVRGWRASAELRDEVIEAALAGRDLRQVATGHAVAVA